MRTAFALTMMVLLSGCWCAPDKGDATAQGDTSAYASGCWAYAKGQDKKD